MRGASILAEASKSLVDSILEIKRRCHFSEEIGSEYGLGPSEIACMIKAGQTDGVSSQELSSAIGLSASRGSRIIGRLVDKRFLMSSPSRGDRRYVELEVTEDGRVCLESIERKKAECERMLLDRLDEHERVAVEEGLGLLLDVI